MSDLAKQRDHCKGKVHLTFLPHNSTPFDNQMPPKTLFDLMGHILDDVLCWNEEEKPYVQKLDAFSTAECYHGEVVGGMQFRVPRTTANFVVTTKYK